MEEWLQHAQAEEAQQRIEECYRPWGGFEGCSLAAFSGEDAALTVIEIVSQVPLTSKEQLKRVEEEREADESAHLAVEEQRQRDVAQAEKEEESRRAAEEQRREEASALQSVVLLPGGISCLFLVHSG